MSRRVGVVTVKFFSSDAKEFTQNAFQLIVHPTLLRPPLDPTRSHRCQQAVDPTGGVHRQQAGS